MKEKSVEKYVQLALLSGKISINKQNVQRKRNQYILISQYEWQVWKMMGGEIMKEGANTERIERPTSQPPTHGIVDG